MRRGLRVSLIVAATLLSGGAVSRAQFYYGPSGPVALRVDMSSILIKFAPQATPYDVDDLVDSFPEIIGLRVDRPIPPRFLSFQLQEDVDFADLCTRLRTHSATQLIEPYYLDRSDSLVVVGEKAIVAFNHTLSQTEIADIVTDYNAAVDRVIIGLENVVVINNTAVSGLGLVDLANALHEHASTRWSHWHSDSLDGSDIYESFC